MIFIVPNLTKEQRDALVNEMESWKANPKLSYPWIHSIKPKGRKIEIDFADGDSVKIVNMLKKRGFTFE